MSNYKERLDEILFHLTDQSGWDLMGTTQEQHNELTAQLIVDRYEAKQAIISLVKELVAEAKPEVPEEYERDDALSIGFTRGAEYYYDAISNLLKPLSKEK